jgi:hypothetical protein
MAVQFMEYRRFHFFWRAMGLRHCIHHVFSIGTHRRGQRRRTGQSAQRRCRPAQGIEDLIASSARRWPTMKRWAGWQRSLGSGRRGNLGSYPSSFP